MRIKTSFAVIGLITSALLSNINTAYANNQAEQQLISMIGGKRLLSSCPQLLEEWEYSVLGLIIQERTFQLSQGRGIAADKLQPILANADALAFTCNSVEVKNEAKRFRKFVAEQWQIRSLAFGQTKHCLKRSFENKMLTEYSLTEDRIVDTPIKAAADFESEVRATTFTNSFRKLVGDRIIQASGKEHNDGIYSAADNLAVSLDNQCRTMLGSSNRLLEKFSKLYQQLSWAPYNVSVNTTQERRFEYIPKRSVLGTREHGDTKPSVTTRHACSGYARNQKNSDHSITCSLVLRNDGAAIISIDNSFWKKLGIDTKEELHAATFRILDPLNRKETNAIHVSGKNKTHNQQIVIPGVVDALRKAKMNQTVNIKLDLSRKGNRIGLTVITINKDLKQPAVVAVSDLLKAYDYAYTKQNLDSQGLIKQALDNLKSSGIWKDKR